MSLKIIEKRDYVKTKFPRNVQELIPIKALTTGGIAAHGNSLYSKTYEMSDIDFAALDDEDKEDIFFKYSDILNSWSGSQGQYKISIFNRNKNKRQQCENRKLKLMNDGYDYIRDAYNLLREEDIAENSKELFKYITLTTYKSDIPKAKAYFDRVDKDMPKRFAKIKSDIKPLNDDDRVHLLYDFLNCGKEEMYVPFKNFIAHNDFRNFISPDGVVFHSKYFEMGHKVGRVLTMREWSKNIKEDFIRDLCTIDTNFMINIDIIPLSTAEIDTLLEEKDSDVEASISTWAESMAAKRNKASEVPRRLKAKRNALTEYTKDITDRNQKVFLSQVSMVILADNISDLDKHTETINEIAANHTCNIGTAWFMQYEGLINTLPFGVRTLQTLRDVTTETLAMLIPFNAQKLQHASGIPYGKQISTGEQIFIDRRLMANGNEIVIGESGFGKSMGTKYKSICEVMVNNGIQIYVDPDGEYRKVAELLGGQVIQIGVDPINALEIMEGYGYGEDPVKVKSDFVITLFEQIIKDNHFFDERKKSIVDRCINRIYYNNIYYGYPFDLTTLYYEILNQNEPEAKDLALALERHILGSFNVFAKSASVDTNYRVIVYDLSRLDKQLMDAGMLVCLDSINNILARNRYYGVPTYIKLDELNMYLQHPNSCKHVESFFQRARKYGGFVTGIIQDIEKLLNLSEARTMINNSENVIMYHQSPLGAGALAEMFGLSEQDKKFLEDCEPGFGINKIGKNIFQFDGRISDKNLLYEYINTDGHNKF